MSADKFRGPFQLENYEIQSDVAKMTQIILKHAELCTKILEKFKECIAENHATPADFNVSFMANRLLTIADLCDFRDDKGAWMPAAIELFAILAERRHHHCSNFCCRWDTFPLVIAIVERLGVPFTLFTIDPVTQVKSKCMCNLETTKSFIGFVNALEILLPRLIDPAAVTQGAAGKRVVKKRQLSSPEEQRELAAQVDALWKGICAYVNLDHTSVKFTAPYSRDSTPPAVEASLKSTFPFVDVDEFCSVMSAVDRPLVSGKIPSLVDWRFANAFATVCSKEFQARGLHLFPTDMRFARTGLLPIVCIPENESKMEVAIKEHTIKVIHLWMNDRTLSATVSEDGDQDDLMDRMFASPSTDVRGVELLENYYHESQNKNFGFNFYSHHYNSVMSQELDDKFHRDAPIAFLALLEHMGALEEQLLACYPADKGWSVLVEERGGGDGAMVLNPLFFVGKENVRMQWEDSLFKVLPMTNLNRVCLPNAAFVRAHRGNVRALLSNNLARFIYYAASGRPLPSIGDTDDDDGLARAAFVHYVPSLTVDRHYLDAKFMHMILCLYFGECDLNSKNFRAYAQKALRGVQLRTAMNLRTSDQTCRETADLIAGQDMPIRNQWNTVLEVTDTLCWDAVYTKLADLVRTSPSFMREFPMLKEKSSVGVGFGPHREMLTALLFDMCKHDTFFLELQPERRQIRARSVIARTCTHCSTDATQMAIRHLALRSGVSLPAPTCMLQLVACSGNVDFWIVHECLRARLELSVTFTMSALVAAMNLDTNNELSAQIELSECGIYKIQVADATFAERAKVEKQRTLDCFKRRQHSSGYVPFEMFQKCYAQNKIVSYNTLYYLINRMLPTVATFDVNNVAAKTLSDDNMRALVSSMISFEPLNRDAKTAFIMLKEELGRVNIDVRDFVAIANDPDLAGSIPSSVPMAPFIAVVATNAKLNAAWRFFEWFLAADYAKLCAFLKAMGVEVDVLLRCASRFFAARDRTVAFTQAKLEFGFKGKPFLGIGPSQIDELDTARPQFELASLSNSLFWLRSDQIRIHFEPDSTKLPTISTCLRVLNLPIGMSRERMASSMDHVIASAGTYLLA
jgi:hypothetical protein